MIKADVSVKKPLVGFFPLFYNLAETGRAALIAQQYEKLGGEVVFFSHGGEYEYLVRELGYEIIRVNPIYSEGYIDLLWKSSRLETWKNPFSMKILSEHVKEEIAAFKKTGIKLVVSTNNFPCCISARAAKIPFISVTPKVIPKYTIYPDDAEFFFTRFIPKRIKLKILNWYAPGNKDYIRPFIKVAKKYGVPPPKLGDDIVNGDYTFFVDFIEFLGLDRSTISSEEYYVGPSFFDEILTKVFRDEKSDREDHEIERHLKKSGKSILLSLGSSGTKELFLKILEALGKTDYIVVAVYTSILKEEELPHVNYNILLKKFVPSIEKLNRNVDLAILSGGKGTVYSAAYAGKPVIGFPMQFEQHRNLEMLVRHGMAIIASRKYFKEKDLFNSIEEIFGNYDTYLKNAQVLASKLPKPEGDKNAARRIVEILEQKHLV
jgi:UDP:flavonoid glycosyltransferase YjiC (YdhE family)